MNCPKCDGGAYVSEEEVVNVLENASPPKVIMKITYICKECSEKFTRVNIEEVDAAAKPRTTVRETKAKEWKPAPGMPRSEFAAGPEVPKPNDEKIRDKLRFLDDV